MLDLETLQRAFNRNSVPAFYYIWSRYCIHPQEMVGFRRPVKETGKMIMNSTGYKCLCHTYIVNSYLVWNTNTLTIANDKRFNLKSIPVDFLYGVCYAIYQKIKENHYVLQHKMILGSCCYLKMETLKTSLVWRQCRMKSLTFSPIFLGNFPKQSNVGQGLKVLC